MPPPLLAALRDSAREPALFTPWSMVHAAGGFAAATFLRALGLKFATAFAVLTVVHLLYEAKDAYFSYYLGQKQDSWPNSIVDQALAMAGFLAGWRLGATPVAGVAALFAVFAFLASALWAPDGRSLALTPSQLWNSRG